MTIKSSQTLVSEALKEIKTISTDEAHEMSSNDQCNLIDIRDIRELWKEGTIKNSIHILSIAIQIGLRDIFHMIKIKLKKCL